MSSEPSVESIAWGERVGAARRKVLELEPDERREGARLADRYLVLSMACRELAGETNRSAEGRAEILEDLENLRGEFYTEFTRFSEEMGVPSF